MAEFEFIDWLKSALAKDHGPTRALPLPPGDDTAIVAAVAGQRLLAADMLLEGVHFRLDTAGARRAGRKALAVNLSDIAAMAGSPEAVTVSLAVPKAGGLALAKELMAGIWDLGHEYGVAIAGGDTNSWDGPLVISVAITGSAHTKGSVRRSGAQAGDWICVTGELGGSLAGKHLDFSPRILEAQLLHERYGLSAMLDVSDGLAADLRHILTASGVGARLQRTAIPISPAAQVAAAAAPGRSALQRALSDGEDFELCFTLPANAGARLMAEQPLLLMPSRLRVSHIGTIESGSGECLWEDATPVIERGWIHELS